MKIPDHLLKRSRALRRKHTAAEKRLWFLLRSKKLGGFKFRRQHVIFNYIVDFFCFSEQLIVELDGPIHNTQKAGNMISVEKRFLWQMGTESWD